MTETVNERIEVQTEEPTSLVVALRSLINEEEKLVAKKSNLIEIHNKLISMVRDEIEIRKKRIKDLRRQINELKYLCEESANMLGIPVNK